MAHHIAPFLMTLSDLKVILLLELLIQLCNSCKDRVTRYLHTQRRTPKIKTEDKALQRRTQKKTPHSCKIHRLAFVQAKCKTYKLQVL